MLMGLAFILMQVKSPMLVSVGMYLPLETTFAIFLGGIVKGIVEIIQKRKNFSLGQAVRTENVGVLLASGFIAGEALMGLVFALLYFLNVPTFSIFENPSFGVSIIVLVLIAVALIWLPVRNRGAADAPPPPSGNF
ncbi:MAG: OPT/YSL family transporter, partial [Bacteroidales bacterium]|nr:OPT/YSL family transporter [Bacteroidales bacterium]